VDVIAAVTSRGRGDVDGSWLVVVYCPAATMASKRLRLRPPRQTIELHTSRWLPSDSLEVGRLEIVASQVARVRFGGDRWERSGLDVLFVEGCRDDPLGHVKAAMVIG
jgi:hypothetical protein